MYLGVKLGLYRALSGRGSLTAAELAAETGLDGWYVREWLQSQATGGLILVDDEDLTTARFTLASGVQEVLVQETGPAYIGGLPLAAGAVGGVLPDLLEAFRTGAGVPYPAVRTRSRRRPGSGRARQPIPPIPLTLRIGSAYGPFSVRKPS